MVDFIEECIENVMKKKIINEKSFKKIKRKFIEIVSEEANCLTLNSPIILVGSISGKFEDLKFILNQNPIEKNKFLFLVRIKHQI
jgi:hypothetical protein